MDIGVVASKACSNAASKSCACRASLAMFDDCPSTFASDAAATLLFFWTSLVADAVVATSSATEYATWFLSITELGMLPHEASLLVRK